jgi:hypothetical protein
MGPEFYTASLREASLGGAAIKTTAYSGADGICLGSDVLVGGVRRK